MRRREFIVGGAAGLAASISFEAYARRSTPAIGLLWSTSTLGPYKDAFRRGLRENGYVEGQNVSLEERTYRLDDANDLRAAAQQIVTQDIDVILAVGTPAALAVKRATDVIPIVGSTMADPVGDGLVANLARPGGNVTGNTLIGPELGPKRLQILREAVPTAARFAALVHPKVFSERTMQNMVSEVEEKARGLGIGFHIFNVSRPDEFDTAFEAMTKWQAEALATFPSPMFYENHKRLVALSARHRLPTMYLFREAVVAGGLMSYGADLLDLARLAAKYVARILRGTRPDELPVEQPTKFEFVINLKTANAMGLALPPTLLASASEVIE